MSDLGEAIEAVDIKNEIELYKLVNKDLRRFYDYIVRSFDRLRNKALALLAGEVAISTFLFQDFHLVRYDYHHHALPIPVYGYAMFGAGLLFLILSYVAFLHVISSTHWEFPTEEHDMKNPTERFQNNLLKYQKYLHSEYLQKIDYCNNKVYNRAKRFMQGTYLLTAGVILILLVKYAGGA